MKVYLIRHGMTKGNEEKRYVGGRTDEHISGEGMLSLLGKTYPKVQQAFVSPMRRCMETAALLYPGKEMTVIEEFRETDFGRFENKNYEELKGDKAYQKWLSQGGTIPGGESSQEVKMRVLQGFDKVIFKAGNKNLQEIALVVHGGTIMYLMEMYAGEGKNFYDYQIGNGEYFSLTVSTDFRGVCS